MQGIPPALRPSSWIFVDSLAFDCDVFGLFKLPSIVIPREYDVSALPLSP